MTEEKTEQEGADWVDEESRKARLRLARRRALTKILAEKSPLKRLQLVLATYPSVDEDARGKSVTPAPSVPPRIALSLKDFGPELPVLPDPTAHIPSLLSLNIPCPLKMIPPERPIPFDPSLRPKVGPQLAHIPRGSPLRVPGCGKCRCPWHQAKNCHIRRRRCFFCGIWGFDYISCRTCRYLE